MSAARSLKMPDMPVAEAIASICMSIASKIGPFRLRALELEIQHPVRLPDEVRHADPRARVLAHVPDGLAEELERERHVRLVHVVHLRDDGRVRDAVGRAGDHQRRHAVVQHRADLLGQSRRRHVAARLGIRAAVRSGRPRRGLASAGTPRGLRSRRPGSACGIDAPSSSATSGHCGNSERRPFTKRSRARSAMSISAGCTGRWLRYRPLSW